MSAEVSRIHQSPNPISILMSGGNFKDKPQQLKDAWGKWIVVQPPWVEALCTGLWGGAQGAFFGSLMGSLMKSNLEQQPGGPGETNIYDSILDGPTG